MNENLLYSAVMDYASVGYDGTLNYIIKWGLETVIAVITTQMISCFLNDHQSLIWW